MTTISAPLVGMHFRPPAKQVLGSLPAGCQLILVPEPENPYDSKAIQVLVVPSEAIPISQIETLAAALEGTGHDIHELMGRTEPLHLGYVADSDGAVCRKRACPGNQQILDAWPAPGPSEGPWLGILSFAPDGQPLVTVSTLEESEG